MIFLLFVGNMLGYRNLDRIDIKGPGCHAGASGPGLATVTAAFSTQIDKWLRLMVLVLGGVLVKTQHQNVRAWRPEALFLGWRGAGGLRGADSCQACRD